jgi:hypothetical protein
MKKWWENIFDRCYNTADTVLTLKLLYVSAVTPLQHRIQFDGITSQHMVLLEYQTICKISTNDICHHVYKGFDFF